MSIIHDMMGKATSGELALRKTLADAKAHAEDLEEALMAPDPEEFISNARHVAICFERQKAAHAHRKVGTLQSELNGAENRRYSRGLACWMAVGFGSQMLLKGGPTWDTAAAIFKLLGAL